MKIAVLGGTGNIGFGLAMAVPILKTSKVLTDQDLVDVAQVTGQNQLENAAQSIEKAVENGFSAGAIRPMEFGGDMGTRAITNELLDRLN